MNQPKANIALIEDDSSQPPPIYRCFTRKRLRGLLERYSSSLGGT